MNKTDHLVDVDVLVDSLTLAEQVSLLAGCNIWETVPIERVGIPSMRVTDGPVGARGTDFNGPASVNTPCGTSLAASFDPALVEEIGHLLGKEARAKGARVLLAPTVNLHRTPIGGRNFECFSEDPYLTAETAVAYVTGLQAEGVASCIKHFVGNDTEFERNTIDCRIDDKTLREMYLVPFEAAVRDADVLSIMTAYNRINGPWAADSKELITDVLRAEWGFDGLVMSDWFGLNSMKDGLEAGLDLEMPGPTRHRGQALVDAVERGEIDRDDIRRAARAVLHLLRCVGAFEDGAPGPETTRNEPQDRALVRRAGAAGMVLLKNSDAAVLPIGPTGTTRVAILGPNAARGQNLGGGSAHVNTTHVVHPLDALTTRFKALGVDVVHAVGGAINKSLPELDRAICTEISLDFFNDPAAALDPDAVPDRSTTVTSSRFMWFGDPVANTVDSPNFSARLSTTLTPNISGPWRLGMASMGVARLSLDGIVLVDNAETPVGGSFFGLGKGEISATANLVAGQTYELAVTLQRPTASASVSGMNIGAEPPVLGEPLEEAVAAAAQCDLAIIVVGTNDDWECEGWDRASIDLPGRQNELIERVASVCPRTVVVINAGSPVAMPWLDAVDAVVMAWFPGQEMGDSLTDLLFGDVEPSGRLPVTFPKQLADTPAFEHYPGRAGVAHYAERRLIGYRWYDTVGREPLFAFGHGLGYASLSWVQASAPSAYVVEVELSNSTMRDGVEVVQVYANRLDRVGVRADEPFQKLVGFAKVSVPAQSSVTAVVHLDQRAYREWSEVEHGWVPIGGPVELRVGPSSGVAHFCIEVTP